MSLLNDRLKDQLDYSIALQRAIRYHCQGEEVMPRIAEKCPHHAQMLNKSLRGHAKEASEALYELVEKLQARVNRLERLAEGKLLTNREIFAGPEAANVRLNAQAEDITELTRRIEELEEKQGSLYADRKFVVNGLAQRVNVLKGRIEKLEGLLEKEQ